MHVRLLILLDVKVKYVGVRETLLSMCDPLFEPYLYIELCYSVPDLSIIVDNVGRVIRVSRHEPSPNPAGGRF